MIHFDIENLQKELATLQAKTNEPNFWQDTSLSTPILAKIKSIQNRLNRYNKIMEEVLNLKELNELLTSEYEEEIANELIASIKNLEVEIEKLEIETLLSGKYDKNNAILTLHPGAGGTESQDWVEMLYRMYSKWAASNRIYCKRIRLFRRR